jgi:hypothetical protein
MPQSAIGAARFAVMAGFIPAIHVLDGTKKDVDAGSSPGMTWKEMR